MINLERTFQDINGSLVVIMPTVLEQLLSHRQLTICSQEAAGVLIGEARGSHLIIRELSEPGEGDIRSRHAVDRRGKHHQTAVDDAFARSGGALQYLGEWHTHPENNPSPSPKDLNSWRKGLPANDGAVLIIVGRNQIWVAKKSGTRINQLIEI
jgi:integrative and conjugative element protein (TIGR02256 family)